MAIPHDTVRVQLPKTAAVVEEGRSLRQTHKYPRKAMPDELLNLDAVEPIDIKPGFLDSLVTT